MPLRPTPRPPCCVWFQLLRVEHSCGWRLGVWLHHDHSCVDRDGDGDRRPFSGRVPRRCVQQQQHWCCTARPAGNRLLDPARERAVRTNGRSKIRRRFGQLKAIIRSRVLFRTAPPISRLFCPFRARRSPFTAVPG